MWNTGATTQTITTTTEGNYIATVTNANGCSASASTLVTFTVPNVSVTKKLSSFHGLLQVTPNKLVIFNPGNHRGAIRIHNRGILYLNSANVVGHIQLDEGGTLIICGNSFIGGDQWTNSTIVLNGNVKVFGNLSINGKYIFGTSSSLTMYQGSSMVRNTAKALTFSYAGSPIKYVGANNQGALLTVYAPSPSVAGIYSSSLPASTQLTCANTCNSSVAFKTDESEILVTEQLNTEVLSVFPNPASETVQMNYQSQNYGEHTVLVYDLIGQLIYTSTISKSSEIINVSIPVSNLSDGYYNLVVVSGENSAQQKFIVQH